MMEAPPTAGWVKRDQIMLHLSSARQTAVSFAAALMTAMLLVGAAVGPLPLVA